MARESLRTGILPLTVDNTGFLLDRLGEDCHRLQFLRELTQNAIEAIQRTPEKKGEIVWDVDWIPYELGEHQGFKLSVTDTGTGMTGEEMVRYINQLSSSGVTQSSEGNFGVGAKIAAATRNHAGLVYLSWQGNQGTMIHLWRHPDTGQYGLRQIACPDGTYDHFGTLEDDIKPELIQEHGTKIVLLGNTRDQDTMKAPKQAPSPSQWVAKYLNSRYFRFPDGVTVRARQGWDRPREDTDTNILRTLTGQEPYLAKHKQDSGTVELTDAICDWWILRDESALTQNSGYIESAGHIAALYKDELYETCIARAGYAKLQQFGVIYGQRRVVLYIKPIANGRRLATNTARTQLLVDSEPLPWVDWAAEFRDNMPAAIMAMMEEIASEKTQVDHSKGIRDRLKGLMDLYKVSRYKPVSKGSLRIDDPLPDAGGKPAPLARGGPSVGGRGAGRSDREGAVGGIYSAFLKKTGQAGEEAKANLFPQVTWISLAEGTRELGVLDDRAARYLQDQNHLLINADFRVFIDMVTHWIKEYSTKRGEIPGLREKVTDTVHAWFEQALVETIIGLQALKGSPEWPRDALDQSMSEEALTAVVMQRYHPFNAIKRELGTQIASLKSA